MARNGVQLQKGLSEAEFDRLSGTDEQCRAVVIAARHMRQPPSILPGTSCGILLS